MLVAKRATWIVFIPLTCYSQARLQPLITSFLNFKMCSLKMCFNNNNKICSKIFTRDFNRASISLSISLQHEMKIYLGKREGAFVDSYYIQVCLNLFSLFEDMLPRGAIVRLSMWLVDTHNKQPYLNSMLFIHVNMDTRYLVKTMLDSASILMGQAVLNL